MNGKEVRGFSPSSLTVCDGDRINHALVDPSGDPHTFSVPDPGNNLNVGAQAVAEGISFDSKVGGFSFCCVVAEHKPDMWGQIVVPPDSAARQS